LITCTFYFAESFPTDIKTGKETDIELLQKSLLLNIEKHDHERNSTNHLNHNSHRSNNEEWNTNGNKPRVLTINKGMNIAGDIKSASINVNNLLIDGKVEVTSLVSADKLITKKLSTNSLSVEKIISSDVIL